MDIIYVQSCGISQGYCWLDQNQTRISDLPDNFKGMLKMVDGDYFSLVIYCANGQLSLLVTALKSQNRIDNQTRKICNSLLWVGNDSDEATLRKLAIQALNGELAAKVDPAVVSENTDRGFTVNFDLLKPENLGLQDVKSKSADDKEHKKHKVGNLSECKGKLIDDLDKYALPKRDGMLVVVCSTVSKSSLEREQVWRGLSDAISDDGWIDISSADSKKSSKENKGDDFRRQPSSSSSNTGTTAKSVSANTKNNTGERTDENNKENDGNNKGVNPKQGITMGQKVLSVLLVISIILNIGLFLQWQEAIKNKKEYDRLLEKSEALKIEISENETKIKTQDKKIAEQNLNIQEGRVMLDKVVTFTNKFNTEGRQLLEDINNFINGIQK
jgi:hypothetical protein